MKVAVTGASGLIGTALVPHLRSVGHEVVRLVRRPAAAPDEVTWDPAAGTVDLDGLQGVDGVVHLAGAGVGDHRWTDDYKREILDSRVDGTHTIVQRDARSSTRPRVLVSALGHRLVRRHRRPRASTRPRRPARASSPTSCAPGRRRPLRRPRPASGSSTPAPASSSRSRAAPGRGCSRCSARPRRQARPRQPVLVLDLPARRGLRPAVPPRAGPPHRPGEPHRPDPVTNAEVTSRHGQGARPPHDPARARPSPSRPCSASSPARCSGSARVVPAVLERVRFVFQDPTIESAIRTALADA